MIRKIGAGIQENRISCTELPRKAANERHFVITSGDDLVRLCQWASEKDFYLCTLVATDERLQEDNVFKLYYVLSAPEEYELVILEYPLSDPQHPRDYPSIRKNFPSVIPLEREIYDLLGLSPQEDSAEHLGGFLLHAPYPDGLHPLRRTKPTANIIAEIPANKEQKVELPPELPEGMLIVPVGPIHAGVIEPGHFSFYVAGEVIEELPIRLGYKHRGVEKLFETHYRLEDGWQLAEKVSGDSSFAHSLAYCQAVEALAGMNPPEAALYWRGLFLELERLYNHIADVGILVHDMAYDRVASPIATLREAAVQLNDRLTGHRLLRGINRPGGVKVPSPADLANAQQTVTVLRNQFLALSKHVLDMPACRERMITTGVLTKEEAKDATGLVRRASGWDKHDFRLRHPQGIYKHPKVQEMLRATITLESEEHHNRTLPIFPYHLQGDVFARMAMRVAEVETSATIISYLIAKLQALDPTAPTHVPINDRLRETQNLEFGIGYVEGWRGDIFYWVMKGPNNTIFRCQVRDPSLFNWHVFPLVVVRKLKKEDGSSGYWENILADFPLINKSFNLSYAGHDR